VEVGDIRGGLEVVKERKVGQRWDGWMDEGDWGLGVGVGKLGRGKGRV
jgi:hypothetical protein